MEKYLLVKTKENEFVMRYANIDYHSGLLYRDETPLGGGMFTFDYGDSLSDDSEPKTMLLWGKSDDFGEPRFDLITDKIHADMDLEGISIILGNIRPSLETHAEDITDKFVFDTY
jgi:hypothetical protein